MRVNLDHKSRFSSVQNRAQKELSKITLRMRQEVLDRPSAGGSKAHSYQTKPKTGVCADRFDIATTPYKMYYDLDRNHEKVAKEWMLTIASILLRSYIIL